MCRLLNVQMCKVRKRNTKKALLIMHRDGSLYFKEKSN